MKTICFSTRKQVAIDRFLRLPSELPLTEGFLGTVNRVEVLGFGSKLGQIGLRLKDIGNERKGLAVWKFRNVVSVRLDVQLQSNVH